MAQRLKIVDTFTGWEGPTYQTRAAAQQALDHARDDFYANGGTQNARFCQAIVPASFCWGWDQRQNQFTWA